jgi:hypothetical protein
MKTALKDIIIEILTIAGYSNDKEKYAAEFEELNLLKAMTHIYDTLPKEIQDKIKENMHDPYAIQQYIPQEKYIGEVIKVTRTGLSNLVKDIAPSLNLYQKEKVNALVVTI